MIFLDSTYLLGLVVPSDSLHPAATAWSRVLGGPFLTTEFVLIEVVNMLSSSRRRDKSRAFVRAVFVNPQIQVEPASTDWFQKGVALHSSHRDKEWSLTDCISFEVMRSRGIREALTYDQHFFQAGFRAMLREPPPAT